MTTPESKRSLEGADLRRVLDQVDVWRKQLINLARSNRLLYFRPSRTATLEINDPETPAAEVVGWLLQGQVWGFRLPVADVPLEDDEELADSEGSAGLESQQSSQPAYPRLLTSKSNSRDLQASLRALDRRATQEFMDKGLWILYLAAGILHWKDPDTGEEADSPLVLIPVRIGRDTPRAPFTLRRQEEEDLVVNPALALKLADYGVELPPIDLDDFDFTTAMAAFAAAVRPRDEWSVTDRLVVNPFSFHKEVMFRDLLDNEGAVAGHEVIQALALGAGDRLDLDFEEIPEERLDDVAPPERLVTILDADATQTKCISAAIAGHSFVMDGPPGTGKSQTIANIVAALLARGKSVLFVSEKAAALEVVHKRLRAAGLSDYCLEIHSQKASRKEVAQELGRALGLHPRQPRPMSDSDLHQLTARRRELSGRAAAMNEIRQPLGLTLHEVLGRIAALQKLPQAPPPPSIGAGLSHVELAELASDAEDLAMAWGPVERGSGFLWRDLADLTFDATREQRIQSEIDRAIHSLEDLERSGAEIAETLLLPPPDDAASAERLLRVTELLIRRPRGSLAQWLSTDDFAAIVARFDERRERAARHEQAEKELLEIAGSQWRAVSASAHEELQGVLQEVAGLDPKLELEASTSADLAAAAEHLRAGVQLIGAATTDGVLIAERFGMATDDMSLSRVLDLADLGTLSAARPKPEAHWLTTAAVAAVNEASRVLEPLCAMYVAQRNEVAAIFTESVLQLDIEGLASRFMARKGLAKLSGQYRVDRRLLAGSTRAGKLTKETVSLLPRVVEWKKTAQRLSLAEGRNSEILGAYYSGSDTDFSVIAGAEANAREALRISGSRFSMSLAAQHLARGQVPDPDLAAAADRIRGTVEPWLARVGDLLGGIDGLTRVDTDRLVAWCATGAEMAAALASVTKATEAVLDRRLPLRDVRAVLALRLKLGVVEDSMNSEAAADKGLFGELYQALDTTWDDLEEALNWTYELRGVLQGQISASAATRLVETDAGLEDLGSALNSWVANRNQVLGLFASARVDELRGDLSGPFENARELLAELRHTTGDIDEWVLHERAVDALRSRHVGEVVDFCIAELVSSGDVPGVIERACLERWADGVLEMESERLAQLASDQLDRVLSGFRQLDRQVVDRAASAVVAACNARRPRTTIGAVGTIRHEAEKSRRHMPVRRLLEATGSVALDLKPCFMMSPLTVSQFLPSTLHFDAVIFDEASQVRPSDAANCIYRGDQLIIAGDDRQLPPTSFFEAVTADTGDEYEEGQFEEYESIIKLGKAGGLRELALQWHYRSQHEDLIAYSNFGFYGGKLVTFPGAIDESDELGVTLIEVPNGVYRRGTARDNPREADAVADRVIHWANEALRKPAGAATLGVVAFSETQASAIEMALERRRRDRPELDPFFAEDRLDGFFVKNLENVQGDERDVMIFSVGYGRDEQRRLTMNFGPLNRLGGERRLNVAITRARRRVEMVSSVTGTEPEFSTQLSEGSRHLQRYLDFAARGPVALAIELGESGLDAESPFEEEVIRVIRSWGYVVQPQVGTAGYRVDIGVRHPEKSGRFALGVECDGRMYHSAPVARDRDRLRQQVLEGLGWAIYRIWGTSWYRYREREEGRLREAIENAIAGTETPEPTAVATGAVAEFNPGDEFDAVPLDAAPLWTVPYRIAQPGRPHPVYQMHVPEAQADLRRMIVEVAAIEGPVHDDVLLRRIREVWGVGRSGERIRSAFERALVTLDRRHEIERLEDRYTYTTKDQLQFVRVPGENAAARRSSSQICLAERATAVHRLVTDAHRVDRDELTFAVCRLFGWNRRGSDIASALDQAVDALLRAGLLIEEAQFLRVP